MMMIAHLCVDLCGLQAIEASRLLINIIIRKNPMSCLKQNYLWNSWVKKNGVNANLI